MKLKSQEVRALAPEMDPLRMGMGWKVEDSVKASDYSRKYIWRQPPGQRIYWARRRVCERNQSQRRQGARYFATDICDGMAQGHDGINYSLASRDTICNMIEIHANATTFDAGVLLPAATKQFRLI